MSATNTNQVNVHITAVTSTSTTMATTTTHCDTSPAVGGSGGAAPPAYTPGSRWDTAVMPQAAIGDFPKGLQEEFVKAADHFAKRFWIVDNSGSMSTTDGSELVVRRDGTAVAIGCTRWAELGKSLTFHAEVAAACAAPTEFLLLNPPGNGAPQMYEAGAGAGFAADTAVMRRIVDSSPTRRTPLCAQIRHVANEIKAMAPFLKRDGQRVAVTIASDGEATDGDVRRAMAELERLPVWVVIRLCTNDSSLMDYWNEVDAELELEMDVLDDVPSEAREIQQKNPWLTYTNEMHRLREWGTTNKIFDLLEEHALNSTNVVQMCTSIYGVDAASDLPNPEVDIAGFTSAIGQIQAQEPPRRALVWSTIRKEKVPVIDCAQLERRFGPPPPKAVNSATAGASKRKPKQQKQSSACAIL